MIYFLSHNYIMLVVFGEVKEVKEHLIECKRCKKEYPSNNFVLVSNNSYSSNCIRCRDDLRKEGDRRKVQKGLCAR